MNSAGSARRRASRPRTARSPGRAGSNSATTIAVVATDAVLTKAEAKRLAIIAQGGLSKGLRLAHAIFDGDIVFAAASGRRPLQDPDRDLVEIGALASDCLARAVARGVYEATALPFQDALPAWRDKFAQCRATNACDFRPSSAS